MTSHILLASGLPLALLLMALHTPPSQAQEAPRTWLQLQGAHDSWRFNSLGPSGPSSLQSEAQLGLPRRKLDPGISIGRLIGQRWRIEVERTSARRAGQTLLAADTDINGVTFLGGAALETEVGWTTTQVLGGWTFWREDALEAGLRMGGQWLKVSQRFQGTGTVFNFTPPGPVTSAPGPRETRNDDVAPIGLFGLFGSWAPAPAWRVHARAEVGAPGIYRQVSVGAQWRANRHLALGLGYRHTRADLDVLFGFIGCCSRLGVDSTMQGPTFSVELAF